MGGTRPGVEIASRISRYLVYILIVIYCPKLSVDVDLMRKSGTCPDPSGEDLMLMI